MIPLLKSVYSFFIISLFLDRCSSGDVLQAASASQHHWQSFTYLANNPEVLKGPEVAPMTVTSA